MINKQDLEGKLVRLRGNNDTIQVDEIALVLGSALRRMKGINIASLDDYNDDLKEVSNLSHYDIMEVYEADFESATIEDLFNGYKVKSIWKREDVDWFKVTPGTKVQVRDYSTQNWINRYFVSYHPDDFYSYVVSIYPKKDDFVGVDPQMVKDNTGYNQCRLYKEE